MNYYDVFPIGDRDYRKTNDLCDNDPRIHLIFDGTPGDGMILESTLTLAEIQQVFTDDNNDSIIHLNPESHNH